MRIATGTVSTVLSLGLRPCPLPGPPLPVSFFIIDLM